MAATSRSHEFRVFELEVTCSTLHSPFGKCPAPPLCPDRGHPSGVGTEAFLAAARRLAEERSLFTWARTSAGATPAIRVVELTVGDATLGFAPDEVAEILERLMSPAENGPR